ncbi:MAG TPA: hypothetical protein VMI93_13755 [Candidatus Solibacter sp.]|nr:hypothetical protein [Candidatus Solibacter sp.]
MKSVRRRKQTAQSGESGLSRREFARGATVAAAAMAALPPGVLGAAALATPCEAEAAALPPQAAGEASKLSAAAMAEVEAKIAEIMRRYGDRLDEAQKRDIRRLVREGQAPLEALRAFPLDNSDEPATILHLPGAAPPAHHPPAAPAAAKPAAKPGA